jgi:hypothetical protein
MLKRFLATAAAMAASSIALAQGVATVDLLDPSDGAAFTGMPDTARAVDIFIDVATTDVWTAAGIRAVTENGASLVYLMATPTRPARSPACSTAVWPTSSRRCSASPALAMARLASRTPALLLPVPTIPPPRRPSRLPPN